MWLLELLTFQMDFILLVTDKLQRSLRNTCKDEILLNLDWIEEEPMPGCSDPLPDYLNSITKKAMIQALMMKLKISWDSPWPTW